jgi:multiple sugar transport system permease protein
MTRSTLERKGTVFWIVFLLIILAVLLPLYWLVNTALKTPLENISPVPVFLPRRLYLRNFLEVIRGGFFRNLFNTIFVAGFSTVISLLLAFLAGYALSRHRFPLRFNTVFLVWVLTVKILPPVVLAIPLYTLFAAAGLLNTLFGLVLVYQVYTLPYCIWMLFGFFKGLPTEYEQAARIDGASELGILWRIVLPLMRSGVIATAIFSIIMAWDEFLFALLFLRTPSLLTLPLRIVNYITEYETLWGQLMAIGLLATVPLLLFSSFVYRRMTTGFTMSLK